MTEEQLLDEERFHVPHWLEKEVEFTVADLRREVAPETDEPDHALKLTGLEGILVALATKLVIGIISGFTSRIAYDKWKEARSRKQLEQLMITLTIEAPKARNVIEVDEATIRHDVTESLITEGLTVTQATVMVDKAISRIKERFTKG